MYVQICFRTFLTRYIFLKLPIQSRYQTLSPVGAQVVWQYAKLRILNPADSDLETSTAGPQSSQGFDACRNTSGWPSRTTKLRGDKNAVH